MRAARRLGVGQPRLTRIIAELEELICVQLFIRNHHSVQITSAGEAYVERARIALLHGERAFQAAQAAGKGVAEVLCVGKSPYTDPALTSALLAITLPSHPRLRIELTSQYSGGLIQELIAGALDLAIAINPPDSRALTSVKIAETPFYIGMLKEDKLAENPSLTLDAMGDRCWVIFERRLHPSLYDAIMRLANKKKVVPTKIYHVTAPEEAFQFIANASALAFFVKAGALAMAHSGITMRPLIERSIYPKTYLLSRIDNDSRPASELVRAFMTRIADWELIQ